VIEALCRTLLNSHFQDQYCPAVPNSVELEPAIRLLRLIGWAEPSLLISLLDSHGSRCLRVINRWCHNRSFIISQDGLVALGPSLSQVGDTIAVLLGCCNPLILRRVGHQYKVLGECYVHGLMSGEAILGPLSDRYSHVRVRGAKPRWQFAFLDKEAGTLAKEDPRRHALREKAAATQDGEANTDGRNDEVVHPSMIEFRDTGEVLHGFHWETFDLI
jgi:hypothetical protein